MNEMLTWDDLRLFLAVARAGGLARAVSSVNVSAPTLSRRMTALERLLDVSLFERHRDGYSLTQAGQDLMTRAEGMERSALEIERWRASGDTAPVVRIAAGHWTSAFLARNMAQLMAQGETTRIELVSGFAVSNLLRREANLGLRNRRPEQLGLAGKRLAGVAYAIYGSEQLARDDPFAADERRFNQSRWVTLQPPGSKGPSTVWLDERSTREADVVCATSHATLEAVRSGAGLAVLPCFIGDTEKSLTRVSELIDALRHDQWLVSHDDDRHNPSIHRTAMRIDGLIRTNKRVFEGTQ